MNLTVCAGTLTTETSRSRGTNLRVSKAQRNPFFTTKNTKRHEIETKERSQRMNAVTPHAFTDYMYFLHYLHVLHGETVFLILHILSIPVKIQIPIPCT